jgi:hypothetical protein
MASDGNYRTQAVNAAHEKLWSRELVHHLPRPQEGVLLAGSRQDKMAILKRAMVWEGICWFSSSGYGTERHAGIEAKEASLGSRLM